MKTMIAKIAGLAIAACVAVTGMSYAAGGPKEKPKEVDWSFAGPFGNWDYGQLQRGFKIYKENCSACHSLDLVAFRDLEKIGFSAAQVKAIAAEYDVEKEPNAEGEVEEGPAVPTDHFPGPYANNEEAASLNNGAVPPDFSLLAKARAVERGFPTFVFDIFTLYAENGPDYIYSLLTGYKEAPEEIADEIAEGTHYNPYYISGQALAMAQPIYDESEDTEFYNDGTPATVDQQAKDVAAFMMWAAEPFLIERKAMGFKVIIFLLIFSILLYLTKKSVFRQLKSA